LTVDVFVIERRVMTAVSNDGNAAHIQQPATGSINRKGESRSQKFFGRRIGTCSVEHHGYVPSEVPSMFDATPSDLLAEELERARDPFRNTRCATTIDARRRKTADRVGA
jgi:hypothetical protein